LNVLIIANAHRKGGLSGSDAIYQKFAELWPAQVDVWHMKEIDFKPFTICYLWRIVFGCWRALWCSKKYDVVYSASDFLMDSLPAFILKLRGMKWIAGFFMDAQEMKWQYRYSQMFVKWLIKRYADMVIVTNPTMYYLFSDKRKTWINGGIDLSLTHGTREKKYDAVFCGRIHSSKGVYRLLDIWNEVRVYKPDAQIAIIGDGDLGKEIFGLCSGIDLLGYMGDDRFEIYKQSRIVLYPAIVDHFSMAPVEAMACGCVFFGSNIPTVRFFVDEYDMPTGLISNESDRIAKFIVTVDDYLIDCWSVYSRVWAQQFSWDKQVNRVWEDIKWLF
jgi:glycosyltransferase involved in cell wall biosynthesis